MKFLSPNTLYFLFFLLALVILSIHLASHFYVAELFSHFALQLTFVALCFAGVFTYLRKRYLALAAFMMCLLSAHALVPLWQKPVIEASSTWEDITVLQININFSNGEGGALAGMFSNFAVIDKNVSKLAADYAPDILVIQEISPQVAEKMKGLREAFPYVVSEPKAGAFGVLIYSKIPIGSYARSFFREKAVFTAPTSNHYTVVHFKTPVHHIPFALVEAHTVPPVSPMLAKQRNQELEVLANLVKSLPEGHQMLIGDFNVSPYSPYFSTLEKASGLQSATRGFGVKNTWPSIGTFLGFAIDHLLVSKRIEVRERVIGPYVKSDHLPVVTRVRLYQ